MNSLKLIFVIAAFSTIINCHSQTLNQNYYSKVILGINEKQTIDIDSIHIDTLILGDNSILAFNSDTYAYFKNISIGKNCKIDGSGYNGDDKQKPINNFSQKQIASTITNEIASRPASSKDSKLDGNHGAPGKNLVLILFIKELSNLTINTTGGDGVDGVSGRDGFDSNFYYQDGGNGEDGGRGGDGGAAGNLNLYYRCEGFSLSFADNGKHSIQLNLAGGNPGIGGNGGIGGRYGSQGAETRNNKGSRGINGKDGEKGMQGKKGELVLKKIVD